MNEDAVWRKGKFILETLIFRQNVKAIGFVFLWSVGMVNAFSHGIVCLSATGRSLHTILNSHDDWY